MVCGTHPCVTAVDCLDCFQATFKRYQMEHKMKQDSLDRSHSELKKLRRKSQGKNANKYELKENEVRRTQTLDRHGKRSVVLSRSCQSVVTDLRG